MKHDNPHKITIVLRVRHEVLEFVLFIYYISKNKKKEQSLLNKSNRHKFFSLPVGESSADSWEDPLVHVTVIVIVFQSINPMIADA